MEPTSGRRFTPIRGAGLDVFLAVLLAAIGTVAVLLAARSAPDAFLDLGPNDAPYLRGFRVDPSGGPDWERDGRTKFHWTTRASVVQFPIRARGDGFRLRARVRRHMVEPAHVTVRVDGRLAGTFDVVGGSEYDYKTIDIALPAMNAPTPVVLAIESSSADARDLGIAIDWLELRRTGWGHFLLPARDLTWLALIIALGYLALRAIGGTRGLASAHALLVGAVASAGFRTDIVASDSIVSRGGAAYLFATAFCVVVLFAVRRRGVEAVTAGLVAAVVLVGVGLRLMLLLHPRYYYPDVQVHAAVARELARQGLGTFLSQLPTIQYRLSLGLQFENGHWYAFPYPPGFYAVCWPFIRFAGAAPASVVCAVAALANGLGILVTFLLARAVLRTSGASILAAVAHAALPLFLIRSVLGYFPALFGQVLDACALLLLMAWMAREARPRDAVRLAAVLALCFLAYTQSIVNFGILVGLFLLLDAAFDRTTAGRRRQALIAAAALAGVVASMVLFYGRYVHLLTDIRHGVPMPEEALLLEKQELRKRYAASVGAAVETDEDEPDPYVGPDINPVRGVRKAVWRVIVFYSVFAISVVIGLIVVLRTVSGARRRFLIAWALTFLVLNLASGGLPSPNLLRYNKDLEIVASLFCVAIAASTAALAKRWRWLAGTHILAFVAFGLWRGIDLWMSMLWFAR